MLCLPKTPSTIVCLDLQQLSSVCSPGLSGHISELRRAPHVDIQNRCHLPLLIRDRDAIYGEEVQRRIRNLDIEEVLIAPRSPWQNPYVERLIGSIRRECLDRVIVLNEEHLRRILDTYFDYYHNSRTHLSLDRNAPIEREVDPPSKGKVISIPQVGGLHHQYKRVA